VILLLRTTVQRALNSAKIKRSTFHKLSKSSYWQGFYSRITPCRQPSFAVPAHCPH